MKFVVEPIWPWPVVVLVILGLLAFVFMTYPRRIAHLTAGLRRFLLGCRIATVVVIAFAMLRPAIHWSAPDRQGDSLLILADKSRSMSVPDGPGGITRRQTLLRALDDVKLLLEQLQEQVDVRRYDFDHEATPVETYNEITDGEQTAIGAVLDSLIRETQSRRVVGILLMGDGAQRALPPYDADPREVARRLGQLHVPVHTVPVGTAELSGSGLDLIATDLVVDPVVFEKTVVPVSARIRALGAANRRLTVRLLLEDLTGRRIGESGVMKVPSGDSQTRPTMQVQTERNEDVLPVELSFVPPQAGEYKLALEVVPLEGERKTRNNRVETIITVRKGGIRVAYFDRIRSEQKFMRLLGSSEKIQLDFQLVRSGAFEGQTQLDPQLFEPGRYDVYIIGDVPAATFGPALLGELAQRVEEGAGLLMTGGYQSFGPGGYAVRPNDALAPLLPVEVRPHEHQSGGGIARDLHVLEPLRVRPTESQIGRYVMNLDTAGRNRERWEALPPLEGANRLQRKNEAVQILAEADGGSGPVPLLFATEAGRTRVMAFAGDTTWRWVLAGFDDAHQRFWRQVIFWLARKEMEGDQAVWVRAEPRNYHPGQPAQLVFGAQTAEGEPIPDAQFQVEVQLPDGQQRQAAPRRSVEESWASFTETLQPGDYWVRVSATHQGESLGPEALTRFIVDERDLELDNPAADLAMLEQISALTGGSHIPPEQLGSFLQRVLDKGFPHRDVGTIERMTLWDGWPLLALFVALMSAEWFTRKKRGLV